MGEYDPNAHVIDRLTEHYQSLPKTVKRFDRYLFAQISLLALGLGLFVGFIIAFKYAS